MSQDLNAELREEVVQQLRMLCMGRVNAAQRLGELLVPVHLKPVAAETFTVEVLAAPKKAKKAS